MNINQFHPTQQPWLYHVHEVAIKGIKQGTASVDYLVETLGVSERYFLRRIKKTLGVSPKKFLAELQMQEAKRMLESGEATTVCQLAKSLGFENAHYFTLKYQQRFGKRPIDYLSS